MPGPHYNDADFTVDELAELIVITELLRINMPEEYKHARDERDPWQEEH